MTEISNDENDANEATDSISANRPVGLPINNSRRPAPPPNNDNGRTFRTLLWLAGVFLTFALGIVIYTAQAVPDIRCDVRENSTRIGMLEEDRAQITDTLQEMDEALDEHTLALGRIQDRLGIQRPHEARP